MTPVDLRCILDWLGLDNQAAAAVLGVGEKTIREWTNGRRPIPPGLSGELVELADVTEQAVDDMSGRELLPDQYDTPVLSARWWRHVRGWAAIRRLRGAAVSEDVQLDLASAATRLGLTEKTLRRYRLDGRLPEPDGVLGRSPWWWASTIDVWQASRPGRGNYKREPRGSR